jgi:hypothetical protein
MKRLVMILLGLVLCGGVTWASITLDSTLVETFQVGGSTVESDTVAALTNVSIDFQAQTVTGTLEMGTLSNGVFTKGPRSHSLTVTINLANGQVNASDGRPNLTLTAAQISAIQSFLTNFRNSFETFVVNQSIVKGTQVAW